MRFVQPRLASDERILFSQRGYFPFGATPLSAAGALLIITNRRLLFAPVRIWRIRNPVEDWVRAKSMSLSDVTAAEPASGARLTISSRYGDTVSFCTVLPTGVGFLWQARDAVPYRDETVRRIREAMRISGSGPGPAEAGDGGGSP
ncbi:hypothetical protein [Micromonospora chokoriensis]|uniref:PH domain-containing protein n=1 Tax=Micromonospora chokoriensis TaxID=356851 RepID=A0A1C4YZC7_9ACTN|nr:hypothetical protein [Micromonospora chokoriensis]SCF26068.1 hypothetical protein GA0070612_5510 [Micromonospora chokoriensis]